MMRLVRLYSELILLGILTSSILRAQQSIPAPILMSPPDSATDQSTTLELRWQASLGADRYQLQVSTTQDFSSLVINDSSITDTFRQVGGLSNGTRYYWRVRAFLLITPSLWSEVWSFTTVPLPPATPTLDWPPDSSTNQPTGQTFSWNRAARVSTYRLQISSDPGFTTIIVDDPSLTTESRAVSGLANSTTYYWRVNASNSGGTSDWSVVWRFSTVIAPPAVPGLVSPELGATNQPTTLLFVWNRVPTATHYQLKIYRNESLSDSLFIFPSVTDTSQVVDSLPFSSTLWWRVRAVNAGGTGDFSGVGYFTTVPPPPTTPILSSPPDDTTNVPTDLTLSWSSASGATSYGVQVSTNPEFTGIVVDSSGITLRSLAVTGLTRNTTYYWRVNAGNPGGTSGWSSVWNFTTIPPPPAQPILASPDNGAINVPTNPTLTWNGSPGATYRLQVSTNPSFTFLVINQSGIPSASYSANGLLNNTTYWWRVNASNPGGTSPWSSVWSFTTIVQPPPIPALLSPPDDTTNIPTNPTLRWSPSSGAASYHLQVSLSETFTSLVIDSGGITGTSHTATGFSTSTVYYWRLNASNTGGTSNWSTIWNFTTVPPPPGVPTLVSPPNDTVNVSINPSVLTWNAPSGASSYRLQVSTNPSFSPIVVEDSGITSTSYSTGVLLNSTTYYWRVNASNPGGTSNWSAAWRFTTITAAPTAPTLVSPDSGAADVQTNPTLAWNGSSGAVTYRLQADTDPNFTTPLVIDEAVSGLTYGASGLLRETTYFWRVNASNVGGTSPWSSIWNFTTLPNPPAQPSLLSPPDSATGQPIDPTLSWTTSTGASSYRLQVSTTPNFFPLVYDSTLTQTSQQIGPLSYSTWYYWHVNAANSGGTSNWSEIFRFRTLTSEEIPGPSLVSPQNGSNNQPTTLLLVWRQGTLPGAVGYHLQVATNANFNPPLVTDDASISDTSHVVGTLVHGTTYFWRVRVRYLLVNSEWSSIWNFTTIPLAPVAPSLASPDSGAIDVPTNPILTWNASPGAETYRLQVSTNPGFSSTVINQGGITATWRTATGLNNGVRYYWRVNATNGGGTGDWSSVWNFTTVPLPPTAPALVSPPNGATNQPTTVTLRWDSVSNASTYHLQVSTLSSFGTTIVNDSMIATASREIQSLAENTLYYWRVRARNSGGSSPWAGPRNFTTTTSQVEAPTLVSPPNGATNQPIRPTLEWNAVIGATSYQLQASRNTGFTDLVHNQSNLTTTSQQIGPLDSGTTYWWRVRSYVFAIPSSWSVVWSFTTIPPSAVPPPAPILVSPANNASGQPATILLNWSVSSGATRYHLQFSEDSSFVSMLISDTTLSTTSRQVASLAVNTKYYWRVRARNAVGWGGYSPTWNFRTASSSTIAVSFTVPFLTHSNPSDYRAMDYRIVGLPGASNQSVTTVVPGTQNVDWQLYWDNGAPSDYLKPFDGSPDFRLTAGRAFWLVHKGPWTVSTSVPAAPLNSSQEVEIPLHQGWNLITNPFTENIAWSQIQSVNSISGPIYSFEGAFDTTAEFRPNTGYYFFNETNLSALRIPYSLQFEPPEPPQASSVTWRVQIVLASSETSDELLWLGTGREASIEKDILDFRKPRGVLSTAHTTFNRPEWDGDYPSFATDIRPEIERLETWSFDVFSPDRGSKQIRFNGVPLVPAGFEVYLIDGKRAKTQNLREDSVYTFTPVDQTSAFLLAVGTPEEMHNVLRSVPVPDRFTLGINYPNPFNASTVIPVEVPNRTQIELTIYNLIGQEVHTLYDGWVDAGKHWFVWRGTNDAGSGLPSGIYFYRLKAPLGSVLMRKMTYLK